MTAERSGNVGKQGCLPHAATTNGGAHDDGRRGQAAPVAASNRATAFAGGTSGLM
jgi:hypothetical protein